VEWSGIAALHETPESCRNPTLAAASATIGISTQCSLIQPRPSAKRNVKVVSQVNAIPIATPMPATSLARLWQSHTRSEEARELLAPIYERFTEGFDTSDLKAAKSLIDDLSQTARVIRAH
jgi:hypothetical protein